MDLVVAQDWEALETAMTELANTQMAALSEDQKAALGDVNAYAQQQVAAQLAGLRSPWYQFFLAHDPGQDWSKVAVPVLGLYGGLDAQVDADQNSVALQAALDEVGQRQHHPCDLQCQPSLPGRDDRQRAGIRPAGAEADAGVPDQGQ